MPQLRQAFGNVADDIAAGGGGGDALQSLTLAQFAATTSAQLRGVLSDELGTGAALFDGATPTGFILTSATGLPISTGVSGLGANVATFLATPSSANLAAAITDETGTGALVFGTGPTISNPIITNIAPGADFTLTQNSVAAFKSVNAGALVNTLVLSAGKVGINVTPGTALDISGQVLTLGSVFGSTARTNATGKVGYLVVPHYTNAEESASGFIVASQASDTDIHYGGGSSVFNAATGLHFYTAANNTTLEGTERLTINSAGAVVAAVSFSTPLLTGSTSVSTPLIISAASLTLQPATGSVLIDGSTASLFLKDTSTGFQASSSTVINPVANNAIRSTSYTSGLLGWNISALGNAEFNNVDVRGAIHASIFTYNAINVTAGTQLVTPSGAKLKTDVIVTAGPTYGTTTFTIDVVDHEGLSHAASQLFAVNDILRLKDGLIGDTWFKVTAVSDQTTFWRYTASIQAGTANVTYRAGMGVPDYGVSGKGGIMLTADQTNAPYLQMFTHLGTFSSADASGSLTLTPQLRLGNLNGSYGYASAIYGLGVGQYGAASKEWLTVDQTNGIRMGNNTTTLAQWSVAGDIVVGEQAAGKSNVWITSGAISFRTNNVEKMKLDGSGVITIGEIGAGLANTLISAGAFALRLNTTERIGLSTAGVLTIKDSAGTAKITLDAAAGMTLDGKMQMLGSSSAIAIGVLPPLSSAIGTGIWQDRNGIWGILGVKQVETTTVVGTVTGSGDAAVTVTAASMAGSPYVKNVAVLDTDSAATVAGKVRTALTADAIVTAFFTVSGSGANVVLTDNYGRANDATMNLRVENGTCTGLTLADSVNTTAGSNTTQAKFDAATGAITAGAGNVALDANGITLTEGSSSYNKIIWKTVGDSNTASLADITLGSDRLFQFFVNGNGTVSNGQINFLVGNSSFDGANFNVVCEASPSRRQYGAFFPSGGGTFLGLIIGDSVPPTTSAILELKSTTGAFLPPRMTTTQRDALTAVNGMILYNTTTDALNYRKAGAWVAI